MITMGELMDAINRHRIVRMATSEEGGDACGEWGVVNPDYEAGLEAYCAELERLVESIYSEATDDNDRKYTLDNGTVEGSTYVTVNLSSKDATMAVLRKLFALPTSDTSTTKHFRSTQTRVGERAFGWEQAIF